MKFRLWKKAFEAVITQMIVLNAMLVPLIIWFMLSDIAINYLFLFLGALLFINIRSFLYLRIVAPIISIGDDTINCIFFKKVRKSIRYSEIKEYGVFQTIMPNVEHAKFIYISRLELTEDQRKQAIPYRLYMKTEDVIVVRYDDRIMDLLKNKAIGIRNYELSW